jgi:hypothetical protein
MGTKGSRHWLLARGLAGAAVTTALAVAAQLASADEGGESFWTPGSFGSLAATPSQPGFSLSSGYYHTSTTAGSEVARARLIRIGRLSGAVEESVSAISISPEDLATVTPGYTFATPVLGGQAAVALTATYGRKRTTDDVTISGERLAGSSALVRSRFESISDTITGFGDLSPQASLRWNSGVHNVMTYMTGNIPMGAYDRARLSNIGIGHGALDGGAGYTYLPLREVVWVILPHFFEELSVVVVVVAVSMWVTRLRCPSCPQRCRRRHLLDQRNDDSASPASQLRRG